jgi:hypothetical protein
MVLKFRFRRDLRLFQDKAYATFARLIGRVDRPRISGQQDDVTDVQGCLRLADKLKVVVRPDPFTDLHVPRTGEWLPRERNDLRIRFASTGPGECELLWITPNDRFFAERRPAGERHRDQRNDERESLRVKHRPILEECSLHARFGTEDEVHRAGCVLL